uniref:SEC7 domain-containing protein n=1 Tax=Strigamia maritima TaxID=126957 RepID=T1IU23_STRMM
MGLQNGIYIVQGEMMQVVVAMRRASRWTPHYTHLEDENDPLLRNFSDLKETLNHISDLSELDSNSYLSPFLEVIRSEDTTGPVTGLALSSINKFLSYGLIDPNIETAAATVENITDAVIHARFVGTDPGSDVLVLMKILQVLRTLVLTPLGVLLTNESMCEIMQSCFRTCFEMRLSELLRKLAEHALIDIVQLLFIRLPTLADDIKGNAGFKKLKMRAGAMDPNRNKTRKRSSPRPKHKKIISTSSSSQKLEELAENNETPLENTVNLTPDSGIESPGECSAQLNPTNNEKCCESNLESSLEVATMKNEADCEVPMPRTCSETSSLAATPVEGDIDVVMKFQNVEEEVGETLKDETEDKENNKLFDLDFQMKENLSLSESMDDLESVLTSVDNEFVNSQGVRFTQKQHAKDGVSGLLIPYGLPCVRELFRFLISLINPLDKSNTEIMIHTGLSLLTIALEVGADHINNFKSLLTLVKDDMCRNLFSVSLQEKCSWWERHGQGLIGLDRITVFASMLRVCFLLFESLRGHLKFQLEMYLVKLMDIIASESSRISYEQREMVLDALVQLWRIPGLVTELYLNYDCDLYCHNLFEDLTKLLSKNAFPVTGLYSTHLLSLDALLTVIDSIESHCYSRILSERENQEKLENAQTSSGEVSNGKEPGDQQPPMIENPVLLGVSGFMLGNFLQKKKPLSNVSGPKTAILQADGSKSSDIPDHEEIMAIKHKKKVVDVIFKLVNVLKNEYFIFIQLLATGTEHFNMKPSKGIQFLQENNLLSSETDPQEIVAFLKENPKLDKKMIGEYISSRKNLKVLEAFVKSFNFEETRVDEALRMYLESFRLPGEAPVISLLLEHFADHWHKTNGEPFVNSDAAFTLAYAVIMLNVDQHNHNVKKQNNPMTLEDFRKNLTNVNGGQDFEQDMLEDVYNVIRNDEIVMPAEHTGLVKENYLWKVLLRRGSSKEGHYVHAPNGTFDHDLFSLIWGPTVAALSFVFDKSSDETIIHRSISGFRKCAMISAHYGMSDVFDNLVISLCKFTTLLSSVETPENLPVSFGSNAKAQLAAKTVFNLAHRHGDILREGWKNLLDCLLQLLKAKLLPKELVEAEDFIEARGQISLIREEIPSQRVDSGLFSSFYSYITLMSESQSQRGPTAEDIEAQDRARNCIHDCQPEHLVTESKFLQMDSLQELVKAVIFASHAPDTHISLSSSYDEDAAVFFLELLIKIVLQNRDRVTVVWSSIRDHIYSLVMGASASEHTFLMERAVVGILRLAIRLLRREDMTAQVLQSLRMLLLLKPQTLFKVSRQISCALYELLKTTAANIHSVQDWSTLFTLLECAGAGARPPRLLNGAILESTEPVDTGAQSDSEISSSHGTQESGQTSDRGYTSDSELSYSGNRPSPYHILHANESGSNTGTGGWILVVGKEGEIETVQVRPLPVNQYNIIFQRELLGHDSTAFLKACESLAFLIRDVAHITPENFESCVHCIRTFVEASLNGGKNVVEKRNFKHRETSKDRSKATKTTRRRDEQNRRNRPRTLSNSAGYQADDDEDSEEMLGTYHQVSIQLLDLMHTLHTRAASIFNAWAEEENKYKDGENVPLTSDLWTKCWCPLLQGIARLCCDSRRVVRTSAVTYLQRALLVHDLQTLTPLEWESCFNKVLFPLLAKLLENLNANDPVGLEETRMRGATLLCKVFLQHLNPLLTLATFTALWLTILDFMDKYMHVDKSDLLYEAIPESLKNMLLVMETAGIFQVPDGKSQLWTITWDRIDAFLPGLRDEVYKSQQPVETKVKNVPENATEQVEEISRTEETVPQFVASDYTSSSIILQPPLPSPTMPRTITGVSSSTPTLSCSPTSTMPLILPPTVIGDGGLPLKNNY